MLIISPFKDFYDSTTQFGIDKKIVFKRGNPKAYSFQEHNIRSDLIEDKFSKGYRYFHFHRHRQDILALDVCFLGFCGRFYPLMKVTHYQPETDVITLEEYFHDKDSVYGKYATNHKKWLDTTFAKIEWEKEVVDHTLFEKFNTPILFFSGSERVVIAPIRLLDYDFGKIKNPFECFQEIQYYLVNTLHVDTRPMVPIEDTVRLEQHGFDKKVSFRNVGGRLKKDG